MISNVLGELKAERGNTMVLLPIAGDLDLDIVEFQKKIYGVSNLPSIVINGKEPIEGFASLESLRELLN